MLHLNSIIAQIEILVFLIKHFSIINCWDLFLFYSLDGESSKPCVYK